MEVSEGRQAVVLMQRQARMVALPSAPTGGGNESGQKGLGRSNKLT